MSDPAVVERQRILNEIEALIRDWSYPGTDVAENVVCVLMNLGMVVVSADAGSGSPAALEWLDRAEAISEAEFKRLEAATAEPPGMSDTAFDQALQWLESRDGGFRREPDGRVEVFVKGPAHVRESLRKRYGERAFPSEWWKATAYDYDRQGGFKETFAAAVGRVRAEVEAAEADAPPSRSPETR